MSEISGQAPLKLIFIERMARCQHFRQKPNEPEKNKIIHMSIKDEVSSLDSFFRYLNVKK